MNKKLLALAVVAAASAPLAAQADVSIYGQLGVSYNSVNVGVNGANNSKVAGFVSNKSRLGFKGDEDLGDGLKGIWNMETEVGVTDSAGSKALNNRNTFVGLSDGSVGTVRVGNFDSPYKRALTDPFGDTMADANNIMGHVQADAAAAYGSDYNDRIKNSIGYDASFNGVDVAAQIGTANNTGAVNGNSRTSAYSASVGYSGIENADFGVAYEKHNNVSAGASAKATKVFGNYTFANLNDLKVGAAYESLKSDAVTNANRKDWIVNASLPFAGNDAVMAEYAKAKSADNAPNTGAKLEAVGVKHDFSKRTSVYAEYARMANDSGATYGFGADADSEGTLSMVSTAAGQTVKGFSLGMVTKF